MVAPVPDEHYRKFFRVATDNDIPDRLSMLACERQGFVAEDFEFTPLAAFRTKGCPPEAVKAKFDQTEKRRLRSLEIVEHERASIVNCLRHAETCDRLTHEQNVLHTQLLSQDPESVSHRPEEAELIQKLLQRESSRQAHTAKLRGAIEKTKSSGANEIEKLRTRQLRSVQNEISLELQREEILLALEQRDQERQQMELERRHELKKICEKAAKDREWKVVRLRRRNEKLWRNRKERLEARREHQDEILRESRRKIELEREKKYQESEKKMQHVKELAQSVLESELVKCELLAHELEAKQHLHDERETNLTLRLHARLRARSTEAQRRQEKVRIFTTCQEDTSDVQRQAIAEKLEAAAERKEVLDTEILEHYRDLEEARIQSLIHAAENRQEKEIEKEKRNEVIDQEFEKKLEHVASVKDKQRREVEVSRALHEVKREQHSRNIQRLKRRAEFIQAVKDAQVEEDLEHELERDEQKRQMAMKLQVAQQRILEEKESLIDQVSRLRSSPKSREAVREWLEKDLSKSPQRVHSSRNKGSVRSPSQTENEESSVRKATPFHGTTPLVELCSQLRPSTA